MYTIKQASRLSGVSEASLRAWERRYAVIVPRRTEAGYRIYDEALVAAAARMRGLVEAGWSPAEAARAVRDGTPVSPPVPTGPPTAGEPVAVQAAPLWAGAVACMQLFLTSAASMDAEGIEASLDEGFSLGSFEHVVDAWLFPTLEALGEGWARGEIDVAGEHAASHAVHRRLAAAFQAAGSRPRGPAVLVGLAPRSHHELGALAFATAARRRGLDVLYLGADVPAASWTAAVRTRSARAAVLCVVTEGDRPSAAATAERLTREEPGLLVVSGGAFGDELAPGVHTLAPTISSGAKQLDEMLHS